MKFEKVLVLIADDVPDSKGEVIVAEGIELTDLPIPLLRDCDPSFGLGVARFYREETMVYADINLNEKGEALVALDLQLFPVAHGVVRQFKGRKDGKDGRIVTQCVIHGLSLCPNNTDVRIPPLRMSDGMEGEFDEPLFDWWTVKSGKEPRKVVMSRLHETDLPTEPLKLDFEHLDLPTHYDDTV